MVLLLLGVTPVVQYVMANPDPNHDEWLSRPRHSPGASGAIFGWSRAGISSRQSQSPYIVAGVAASVGRTSKGSEAEHWWGPVAHSE